MPGAGAAAQPAGSREEHGRSSKEHSCACGNSQAEMAPDGYFNRAAGALRHPGLWLQRWPAARFRERLSSWHFWLKSQFLNSHFWAPLMKAKQRFQGDRESSLCRAHVLRSLVPLFFMPLGLKKNNNNKKNKLQAVSNFQI